MLSSEPIDCKARTQLSKRHNKRFRAIFVGKLLSALDRIFIKFLNIRPTLYKIPKKVTRFFEVSKPTKLLFFLTFEVTNVEWLFEFFVISLYYFSNRNDKRYEIVTKYYCSNCNGNVILTWKSSSKFTLLLLNISKDDCNPLLLKNNFYSFISFFFIFTRTVIFVEIMTWNDSAEYRSTVRPKLRRFVGGLPTPLVASVPIDRSKSRTLLPKSERMILKGRNGRFLRPFSWLRCVIPELEGETSRGILFLDCLYLDSVLFANYIYSSFRKIERQSKCLNNWYIHIRIVIVYMY